MSAINDKFISYIRITDSVKYKLIFQFPGGAYTGSEIDLPAGFIKSFEYDRTLRDSEPIGMQEADQLSMTINLDLLEDNDDYSFSSIINYFVKGTTSFTPTTISMSGTSSKDVIIPNHVEILSNQNNPNTETYDTRIFAGVQEFNQEVELTHPEFDVVFTSDIKFAKSQLKPNYIDLEFDTKVSTSYTNSQDFSRTVVDLAVKDSRDSNSRRTHLADPVICQFFSFINLETKINEQATYIIRELRKNSNYNLTNVGRYDSAINFYNATDTENYNKDSSTSSIGFIAIIQSDQWYIADRVVTGGFLDPNDSDGFEKSFKTCWDLENALMLNFYGKGLINYDSGDSDFMSYNNIYSKLNSNVGNYGTVTLNSSDIDKDSVKIFKNTFNHKRSKSIVPNLSSNTGDGFDANSISIGQHEYSYESGTLNLNAEEPENELVFHNLSMLTVSNKSVSGQIYRSSHLNKNGIFEYLQDSVRIAANNTVPNHWHFLKVHDYCELEIDGFDSEIISVEDLTSPTNYDPIPLGFGVEKFVRDYNKWILDRNVQSGLPYLLAKADVEVFTKNKMSRIELELKEFNLKPDDIGAKIEFDNIYNLSSGQNYIAEMITNEFILSSYKLKIDDGKTSISCELFGTGR